MADKTDTATSTELVEVHPRGRELMDTLGIRFTDPAEFQWDIAERLATAENPDQLFGDNGPQGLRDHLGKPFYVKRVRYLESSYKQGAPLYAVIDGEDAETSQPVLYSSGATSVLIQLARAEKEGWLDRPVMAKQTDEPTANGYYPYRLVFS